MSDTLQAHSISEACKILSIGRSTFYSLLKAGQGPRVTKISARSVIFDDDLRAWVAELRPKPRTAQR